MVYLIIIHSVIYLSIYLSICCLIYVIYLSIPISMYLAISILKINMVMYGYVYNI